MKICVIGTGYVGLVSGAGFADVGNHVICVDIDAEKINRLNQGMIPIFEPGLDVLVTHNERAGRLLFSTDIKAGIEQADICFIAVGTPPGDDGATDLSHVVAAAEDIGKSMNGYKMVGMKSTVPVGTCDRVQEIIAKETSLPFSVFSNPEFLKEGDAVNDFMRPDRIVVGTHEENVRVTLRELYQPFNRKEDRVIFMGIKSAELTKYAANAMLATRISFMNEMANLAEKVGANIDDVRLGIGSDPRIGNAFLFPGIGYGGSCFPKDVRSLLATAKQEGSPLRVLEAVEAANQHQKSVIIEKVKAYFGGEKQLIGKKIAIWGLAFKPNTDDIREASALSVITSLLELGATVTVYDPVAVDNVARIFADRIHYTNDPYACLENADALIVATEWHDFRSPDVEMMKRLMKRVAIFDGRNIYAKLSSLRKVCDFYWGIGV